MFRVNQSLPHRSVALPHRPVAHILFTLDMTYTYVYVGILGNIKSLYIDTVKIHIYIYMQCSVFPTYLILHLHVLYKQYCFPEPWFLGWNSSNDLQQTAGNLQFYVKDLLPRLTSTSAKVACFEVVRKVRGVNAWQGWGGRNPWNMFVYNDMCFFDVCILSSLDNFLYVCIYIYI